MEEMDKALEKLSQRRGWLVCTFLLASSPGIFNAWHIMVTLFFGHIPTHWCRVPLLEDHNWSNEQIRNISSPVGTTISSCSLIGWNYTQMAQLGYETALRYTSSVPKPPTIPCTSYMYDEDVRFSSTVSQWDLVCDRLPMKSSVQSSIAFGKFVGGLLLGFVADKYGRKCSFVVSCLLYMTAGPLTAFATAFWFFLVTRFLIGIAGSGTYEAAFTILTELSAKEYRAKLGSVYNMTYPVGYISLSLIAYIFPAWRSLQLAISLPMLFLLINCWYLPESPRWLMTQGRQSEAWAIVKSIDNTIVSPTYQHTTNVKVEGSDLPLFKRMTVTFRTTFGLFINAELCKRIAIAYFTWFSAALSYYALALNADNFSSNRYVYLALSGLVEVPSYILPLIILMWLGRKATSALLFMVSGITLLSIIFISQENKVAILVVALLGRFADCAVFSVVILHTSELFPTSARNTAVGTSLAFCQLGSILAPYVVDILGKEAWYLPSTLCGGLAISSALLCLLLPETRNRPLMETVQDLKESHRSNRVSLRNCCSFS